MKLRRILLTVVTFVALAGAVVLFTMSSTVFKFSGRMPIGLGRQESVAVGVITIPPRWKAPNLMQVYRNEIPFEDPETGFKHCSESEQYTVARLPFSVRVDKIDAPPTQHLLKFSGPDPAKYLEIKDGDNVSIDGATFKITGLGEWSGLMRDPQGVPMAAVTLAGDGGAESAPVVVLLASDIWQVTPGGTALCFKWHPGEAEARQAANGPPTGLESARWGVIDRGAVNWFATFTPGTGAFLSGGEEVTLVAFDENKPAVEVEIKQGVEKRVVCVAANQIADDVPIRFEYPALAKNAFIIHAWEDGKAIAAEFKNGQPAHQKELPQRQWFYPAPAQLNLRLDDVFSNAVAVTKSESKLWAAVLKSDAGEEIVLRQGEARPIGDSRIEYCRQYGLMKDPQITYTLTIGGDRHVMLKTHESVRKGDWRLRPTYSDDLETVAVLDADYTPGRRWAMWLAGIGLAALVLRIAARTASGHARAPLHIVIAERWHSFLNSWFKH